MMFLVLAMVSLGIVIYILYLISTSKGRKKVAEKLLFLIAFFFLLLVISLLLFSFYFSISGSFATDFSEDQRWLINALNFASGAMILAIIDLAIKRYKLKG